jgi:hypothetical protein
LARTSLTGDPPATSTVVNSPFGVGQNHSAFLMPLPRAPLQRGHYPICQQCHEDARDVGSLDATGTIGAATAFTVSTTDGTTDTDNPRFQTFPHETVNAGMVIESADVDLCTNCHPAGPLP